MKHLTEYIQEQRIDEFFGLQGLVNWFKRIFMPWTDEAKRWYHKFFMESREEIYEAKKIDSFPKVLDQKYDKLHVEVYDLNSSKSTYKKVGKKILKNAEKSGDDPMLKGCDKTSKDYKYFYKIYASDPEKAVIGVIAPDKDKKLVCISSVSDPDADKNTYKEIFKDEKTINKIFDDIQKCLK